MQVPTPLCVSILHTQNFMQPSPATIQFLTIEEAQAIDRAMLSPMEKFMTRITVSAMRVLIKMAESLQAQVEELQIQQIVGWIEQDSQIRKEQGAEASFLKWSSPTDDLDFEDTRQDEVTSANLSSHEKFLARMVISARSTIFAIAKDVQTPVRSLTIEQVVSWTERDAAIKRSNIE